jgi:hypothetical protein
VVPVVGAAVVGAAQLTYRPTPGQLYAGPMDGILRRVSGQTWEGTLREYRVIVSSASGWHYAVINAAGHTEVCPRVATFEDGARQAREWIEGRIKK